MKNEKSFDEAYKKLCDCHAEVIADSESNFIKTRDLEQIIENLHEKLSGKVLLNSQLETLESQLKNALA